MLSVAVVSRAKRSLSKTPVSVASFSNTKTRRGASVSNSHRPSPGAVHRYQVVAAANPNPLAGLQGGPPVVAMDHAGRALNQAGLRQVVVDGAGSLGPAELEGSASGVFAHPDAIGLSFPRRRMSIPTGRRAIRSNAAMRSPRKMSMPSLRMSPGCVRGGMSKWTGPSPAAVHAYQDRTGRAPPAGGEQRLSRLWGGQ